MFEIDRKPFLKALKLLTDLEFERIHFYAHQEAELILLTGIDCKEVEVHCLLQTRCFGDTYPFVLDRGQVSFLIETLKKADQRIIFSSYPIMEIALRGEESSNNPITPTTLSPPSKPDLEVEVRFNNDLRVFHCGLSYELYCNWFNVTPLAYLHPSFIANITERWQKESYAEVSLEVHIKQIKSIVGNKKSNIAYTDFAEVVHPIHPQRFEVVDNALCYLKGVDFCNLIGFYFDGDRVALRGESSRGIECVVSW